MIAHPRRMVTRDQRGSTGRRGIPSLDHETNRARTALRGSLTLALAAGLGVVGVVGGACAPTIWQRAGDSAAVASTLSRVPPSSPSPQPRNRDHRALAFLVLGGARGSRLTAIDLAAKKVLWVVAGKVSGRIVSGSSILVHADGGALVGRDIVDGRERWRVTIPGAQTLMGYAVDGDAVFYVARSGNALRGGASELVGLEGLTGNVRWRHALETANVAAPAAAGGLVLVPNRSQFVSIVDAKSGAALAEVLSKEQAANFVIASPQGFYYGFGSDGVFRLSPGTAAGVRASPEYFHARLPAFVRVNYERDMYRTELLDYSALDRNRVLWRIDSTGEAPHFQDDTVVALDYRFFFAFEPSTGKLRWAYSHPQFEAVSAVHQGNIILFVTADGEIAGLDPASGARRYDFRLAGENVRGGTFDSEGFGGDGERAPPPSLPAVLASMVRDPDRRFAELQIFAIEQMRGVPGAEITAELLHLMADEDMSPIARQRAGQVLIARQGDRTLNPAGSPQESASTALLVEAIRIHADRVDRTRPAGLSMLAAAAGKMKVEAAALPLAEHLALPETDPATATAVVRALASIGSDAVVPALRDFLCQYRADSALEEDAAALLATVDALMTLGKARERELLSFLAVAPRTLPVLREHILRSVGERFTQP
jgi:outer membrane protein assembly factor BamB